MKHCLRTANLQHREAQLLLAAFQHFQTAPFTRKELAEASTLPINVVCGRVFTLIERGALKELPDRRNRAALIRLVVKPEQKRRAG